MRPLLRRPSDLAREGSRGPGRAASLEWPPGFAASPDDRTALLVLLGLASLTARRLLEVAAEHRTAAACLRAVGRGQAGSESDREWAARTDPARIVERLRTIAADLVAAGDAGYPQALLELYDPPAGLFVRGAPLAPAVARDVPEPVRVAIVGARTCSPAGREIATSLGRALGRSGASVVSGAARGIDAAAHVGALEVGGATVAVLGSGIDVAYPKQNEALLARIAEAGTVVSEYPPGVRAEPFRFPARNRIVAALAKAVVVVEGSAGSGSMITADHAIELGRDVYAVPGAVTSELSQAPLGLIREGAGLIRGPEDLLGDLGLAEAPSPGRASAGGGSAPGSADLTPAERAVWDALLAPTPPDALAARLGMPLPPVMACLLALEIRGFVRHVGGRYERRLVGAKG